ncbi:MAG: efflux RND transporter periplasmic adaptor subunit [Flavobacteriales bacterium]|nr:efflux RND transporter periplasmic adaptor subunit [Flavobacteriales bacterium]
MLVACGEQTTTDSIERTGEILPVQTISFKNSQEPIIINTTGLVSSKNETQNGFKIGGVISEILVEEGQSFKKGQLLATLIPTEIDAGFSQAELALEKATRDYERVKRLYENSVATLEQLQNTKTLKDVAEEQLEVVQFNKEYSKLYAQEDGFVIRKLSNNGEVVGPGQPVLIVGEVGDNHWVVNVGLSGKQWAAISERTSAAIEFDAYPNQTFNGMVSKKAYAADPASGSFNVELKVTDFNVELATGLFARVAIQTGDTISTIELPHQAIIEADGNNAFVFVPHQDSLVRKLPVEIASFSDEKVSIISGLEKVSEVIVSNSAFLNEQSRITINNQ